MSGDIGQGLVKLVREVVRDEQNKVRTNTTELAGHGGDTVISSVGNIYIQPGTNKKAYYHDTEIGSGSGSGAGGTTVKVSANDTTAGYLNGKLVAGANISLTEGSDGGNETLTVALTGGAAGDVFLAIDNIFTGDHQTIRGAGGSEANYPTLLLRNTTHDATDYKALQLDDSGYLDIGQADLVFIRLQGGASSAGRLYPTVTDSFDLGATDITRWWRNVYAQTYYVDNASTYISLVGTDLTFFDANNPTGVTLSAVGAGGDVTANATRTTNYLTKWTNTTTKEIGNSHIYDDNDYVNIRQTAPYLRFQNGDGSATYSYIANSASLTSFASNGHLYLSAVQSAKNIYLETVAGARMIITNTGITSVVPLAMTGQKITGLAAGTTSGDALRYEQVVGSYLLLSGGTMTGAIAMGNYNITGTGDVMPHDTGNHYNGDATHTWAYMYSRNLTILSPDATTNGYVNFSNAEELTFTVPAGGKFKFVVS